MQIPRSSVYYKKKDETGENIKIMKIIKEKYNKDPTLGYRRMTAILRKKLNKSVNKKRVHRLMRKIGLKGIFPKRKLTKSVDTDIKNMIISRAITKPNQVWVSDITYIRVNGGYAYGVFIMDQCSRKVISYEISNTMDEGMCVKALEKGIKEYGAPEIMHTDRGSRFMGRSFRYVLEREGIKSSAGERGYKDNIYMERLFRTYKWEYIYLMEKMNLKELKEATDEWVRYYNSERLHQALGYRTPDEVYYGEGMVRAS